MNRRILEIAAFVALAVFAVIGWMHRSAAANAVPVPLIVADQNAAGTPVTASNGNPIQYSNAPPNATAPLNQQGVDSYYQDPYSSNRPVYVRSVAQAQPYYAAEPAPAAAAAYAPEYVDGPRAAPRAYAEPRTYRHGRSAKRSVALVAGSAGVGAAVGALAGGGKGAGIGALAGGGAGLIYDRLTHKTHTGL